MAILLKIVRCNNSLYKQERIYTIKETGKIGANIYLHINLMVIAST